MVSPRHVSFGLYVRGRPADPQLLCGLEPWIPASNIYMNDVCIYAACFHNTSVVLRVD